MGTIKISALTAAASVLAPDELPVNEAGVTKKVTASQLRQYIGEGLNNASSVSVAAGYAADTYLAGSAITIPTAGGWRVGTTLRWTFDMTKTAAGTATFTIIIRMGTLGTTGDAAILTLTTGTAGTAATDQGVFDIVATFRTVGAGTAAVIVGGLKLLSNTAGLSNANKVNNAALVSAGFNSTTQTIIGLSVNGGASFSGTNNYVVADADNI